jgi:hypothetical protein
LTSSSAHEDELYGALGRYLAQDQFQSQYRMVIGTKSLLSDLAKLESMALDEIQVSFEKAEPGLRVGYLLPDWAVRYNAITDQVLVERILEREQLQRIVDFRNTRLFQHTSDLLFSLDGFQFQRFVKDLFSRVEWVKNASEGTLTNDGGIDFRGEYRHEETGLTMPLFGQVKRWKNPVGSPPIRDFIGGVISQCKTSCTGVFVALGGFTAEAIKACEKSPFQILRFDLPRLVNLMAENEIGIKATELTVTSPDLLYWVENFGKKA